MELPAEGTCQCGSIKYKLKEPPVLTYACHCRDCQTRTGSAFSMGMLISSEAIELEGELTHWSRTSDDGNINTRFSCAGCGNIIYGVGSFTPEVFKLQPGTLLCSSDASPDVHIWTDRAQKWLVLPPQVPQYATQPDNVSEIVASAIEYRQSKKC